MRAWIRLIIDRGDRYAAKVSSLLIALVLLNISLLLVATASAQPAGDSRSVGSTDNVLSSSVAGIFRGIPYVDTYGEYLRGSAFTFYVGKIHSLARHFRYELESTGDTVPLIRHVNYIGVQHGFWLGAAWKAPLTNDIGLSAEAWALVPNRREVYGTYMHNLNPPIPGDLPDAMDVWREWSPNTNAWFVDLYLTANPGLSGYGSALGLVCGGRYDSYYRSYRQSLARGRNITLGGDEMQMDVHMLVPYIGVQVGHVGQLFDLAVRMIGTPIVFGGLKHEETFGGIGVRDEGWFPFYVPRGYWAELFAEGGLRVTNEIALGGFLKMTSMTLMSNEDLTRHSITGAPSQQENYDLTYRRIMYTYGAKVMLRF